MSTETARLIMDEGGVGMEEEGEYTPIATL